MTRDFTDQSYAELLETGRDMDYEFLTVREYVQRDQLPDRFLLLRHDVDRKPQNSLRFAHLEAERGIESTYYVRTVDGVFDPDVIRRIEALGHEIGYHYEDLDRAGGDMVAARRLFAQNLTRLRRHATIDTVCMYSNPLTTHDNRDMWDEPADLAPFDLVGEASLSIDDIAVDFFSDTDRTWEDSPFETKEQTMDGGEKRVSADSTADLVSLLLEQRVQRAQLLTHPNRWADSTPELIAEATKDAVTNAGKLGFNYLL